MFNVYQYEKLEQDEFKRVNSTNNHPKKIEKYLSKLDTYSMLIDTFCLEEREEKAYKYKLRVVTFMEQAAEHPEEYVLPDEFNGGVQAKKVHMNLLGKERFKFTTNAKDEERIKVFE